MTPKRYSIYANATLDRVLAERLPHGDPEGGARSRSATITYMADRYAETCRRSMPLLSLQSWLLIFDAMNGCYTWDHPWAATSGLLAPNVHDACDLDGTGDKWGVTDWRALVANLASLPFAAQIAVLDAAERFWAMDVQQGEDEPSAADPFAHWRAAVRNIVGKLADDNMHRSSIN